MLTSERLFSVSTAATTILALASVVVRVVVVVRLLHTFVAEAYHVMDWSIMLLLTEAVFIVLFGSDPYLSGLGSWR
jgi:hypothetical protein